MNQKCRVNEKDEHFRFLTIVKENLKSKRSTESSMARIGCVELEPWMEPLLKKGFSKHRLVLLDEPLSSKNVKLVGSCDVLCTFIYSPITKNVLSHLPHVKLISTMSTGFDHIDVTACKSKGVMVCNVPFYGENTVAEHTMALMLAISRRLPDSIERTRKGDFSLKDLRGFDLKGKTLGVVGSGHIGQNVIQYAKAFGMKVIVSDAFKNLSLAKSLGFEYMPFQTLLSRSDIVSFHVPYNPKTHHMLNESNLKKLKRGVVIINTSRGGVIETEALLHGLKAGIISYAGLDVLEGECLVKEDSQLLSTHFSKECDLKTVLEDHLLLKHPRVFVTPHNAFNSEEALKRIVDTTIANVTSFLAGRPQNVVRI